MFNEHTIPLTFLKMGEVCMLQFF